MKKLKIDWNDVYDKFPATCSLFVELESIQKGDGMKKNDKEEFFSKVLSCELDKCPYYIFQFFDDLQYFFNCRKDNNGLFFIVCQNDSEAFIMNEIEGRLYAEKMLISALDIGLNVDFFQLAG